MNRILFTNVQFDFLSFGRSTERILLNCSTRELSRQRFSTGENVESSIGIILLEEEMERLKTSLNAVEFEKFRDKKPAPDDPYIKGYWDECRVEFTGITNSSIPLIRIDWNLIHDDQHMWPHEKLFKELNRILTEYEKKPAKKKNVTILI